MSLAGCFPCRRGNSARAHARFRAGLRSPRTFGAVGTLEA
ncbi:conserved hypothetical protein [Burkholderia pseudomallei 406e]|uniref:Uncharacterized protein n=2 Tax=Burkholderia pseudomallei TaxID=28450 RepID=Q3JI20_BURP1|nr:hypothetical protein BURPS1710b_A1626 [Burkholderia pseudomallei 1710b]ABN85655.1 conserved hypothetical protein [Burkholderia pseudomallei 668]ABN93667.1 conserved hypothetical protein [Burkholderia pseudomallei 1106a]AFR18090.1 hypothetical protein BPC006_II0151 [Burkholderia pseudomallei BPC006]EBA47768.1 hypothetical protein BURPS305_3688 [Burkholderia pseudomallei 305]EDO86800.1 conserved hypothetical protein [Burkholderia pseudomallei 406e]EDO92967.1 conserved hypothetical protein [B